jgi:zinc/manganese transport system permease protein
MSSSRFVASDPITGIAHMLSHPFFAYAFLAGTFIALAAGMVGYFLVLRRQVFTGDALSHVAFTGAAAALAIGIDLRVGLFAGCIVFGMAMAALGRRGNADDVVIGSSFAWVLGLGVLFLTIYTTSQSGAGNGKAGVSVLFGSIFGLSSASAIAATAIGLAVAAAVVAMARPLLFASVDEAVAAARGVPVRALGIAFLGLVGVTAAEATQAVGSLLLLGLLAAPAGAAHRLTDRPYRALWLSAVIAIASVWFGLSLSYAAPQLPPSFAIMLVATAAYGASYLASAGRRRHRRVASQAAGSAELALSGVDR